MRARTLNGHEFAPVVFGTALDFFSTHSYTTFQVIIDHFSLATWWARNPGRVDYKILPYPVLATVSGPIGGDMTQTWPVFPRDFSS